MTSTAADAQFWNRIARVLARDAIKDMAGYARSIERTRQYLKSADVVLELGCGTGSTALRLAPDVARLVATDVSAEMIAIAREKAAHTGCQTVEFTVALLQDPGQDAGPYDVVLAFNVLHLIAHRPDALARISRHMKPGGLVISKTPCLSEMSWIIRMAVPLARAIGKAPYVEFFTAADLEREIETADFILASARGMARAPKIRGSSSWRETGSGRGGGARWARSTRRRERGWTEVSLPLAYRNLGAPPSRKNVGTH